MKQPNIILITSDQQRFDTCGFRAPSYMRTPNYNFLCGEGVEFLNAYAQFPLCVPSRFAIMTGKDVCKSGIGGNVSTEKVMGRDNTLPVQLKNLGYQTIAIGKMHFNPQRARHGFEEMIIPDDYYREMNKSGSPYQPMRHGLGQNEICPSMATVPETQTLTSWITEKCVDFIKYRRDPSAPYFLWCSYSKPHPPLDPPEPYYSMYRNCNIEDPVYGDWSNDENCPMGFIRFRQNWSLDKISKEIFKEAKSAYLGLITQIDYNLGRIFSVLRESGEMDNTLIIYTSDHGELLGDHHSGAKTFFYEGAAHVPFVIRFPKAWKDRPYGLRCEYPVSHHDVMPTIIEAAGGNFDGDGNSLLSIDYSDSGENRFIESCCPAKGKQYAGITNGKYKYIWYPEGAVEQFFDLAKDPRELHNAIKDEEYNEYISLLRGELIDRHKERNSDWVNGDDWIAVDFIDDTERERRSLNWKGYHSDQCDDDVRH